MIKFIARFLLLVALVLLTNRYDHDYSVLASSFHRGEVKFSLVVYAFQLIRGFFEYDYIIVHLFYVSLFSWSVVKRFEPGLMMIIIAILPIGYILNEQIRFFAGLAFGLVSPLFSMAAFVIHPGASAISAVFWFSKILFRFGSDVQIGKRHLVVLSALFVLAPFVKVFALKAASVLGYGYVGSEFFESSSLAMKIFKGVLILIVIPNLRYLNFISFYMLAISIGFDSLAIVSGRTIIMFFILVLLHKRYSQRDFRLQPLVLSKGFFLIFLIISLYVRFFDTTNFG